jgi:hypothetical protein
MKKRFFKARPKSLPKGYDSQLEYNLHQTVLKDATHHVDKGDRLPYAVEHTYEPDFLFQLNGKLWVVEVKGRFRDSTEAAKYIWVRKMLEHWPYYLKSGCSEIELILLFENAATPMPFSKRRKDGTKLSHGEWATKNGFRWLCGKSGVLAEVETKEQFVEVLENA